MGGEISPTNGTTTSAVTNGLQPPKPVSTEDRSLVTNPPTENDRAKTQYERNRNDGFVMPTPLKQVPPPLPQMPAPAYHSIDQGSSQNGGVDAGQERYPDDSTFRQEVRQGEQMAGKGFGTVGGALRGAGKAIGRAFNSSKGESTKPFSKGGLGLLGLIAIPIDGLLRGMGDIVNFGGLIPALLGNTVNEGKNIAGMNRTYQQAKGTADAAHARYDKLSRESEAAKDSLPRIEENIKRASEEARNMREKAITAANEGRHEEAGELTKDAQKKEDFVTSQYEEIKRAKYLAKDLEDARKAMKKADKRLGKAEKNQAEEIAKASKKAQKSAEKAVEIAGELEIKQSKKAEAQRIETAGKE